MAKTTSEKPADWEVATRLVRGGSLRSQFGETAEAIFLTNSLIGVRAVGRLGDREWSAHPLTSALATAWAALAANS